MRRVSFTFDKDHAPKSEHDLAKKKDLEPAQVLCCPDSYFITIAMFGSECDPARTGSTVPVFLPVRTTDTKYRYSKVLVLVRTGSNYDGLSTCVPVHSDYRIRTHYPFKPFK